MMVFYSGGGTWFNSNNELILIDYQPNGVFLLSKKSQLEIKYKGETWTNVLLPCYNHKDGFFLNGFSEKDEIYLVIADADDLSLGKKYMPDDLIKLNESELLKTEHEESSLDALISWQKFKQKAEKAIVEYPEWASKQNKIQKTGNLNDWISLITDNTRETDLIKCFLTEKFKI